MKEKGKHIDEVFRERLSDLNVTPPADAWRVIESSVHRRKMRSFYIPRLVAASLLLFVLTGSLWLIFLRKPSNKGLADQPVFSSQQNKITNHPQGEKTVTHSLKNGKNLKQINQKKKQPAKHATEIILSENKAKAITTYPYQAGFLSPAATKEQTEKKPREIGTVTSVTPLALLNSKNAVITFGTRQVSPTLENIREEREEYAHKTETLPTSPVLMNQPKKKGTWGIGGDFGPFYAYRQLTEGSPMITSYMNAEENGIISFAGNLSFFYKGAKRLTIQSGLSYYRMGQEVNDVIAFRMIKSGALAILETKGNDYINVSEGKLGYSGTPVFVANKKGPDGNDQVDFLLTRLGTGMYEPVDVQLKQEMEFVEIPLLLRYSLINKTFGLNLIGGMGTSILVKGQTSLISDQGTTFIGDMYELQKTNINGTLGLGFSYKLSTSLRLRVEPTLKYYLNPVYKSPEFSTHPYSIGIYSGMSFYF